MGSAASELGTAVRVLRSLVTAPWLAVYPVLVAVLLPLTALGGVALGIAGFALYDNTVLGYAAFVAGPIVLAPLVYGVLGTAYCYELNERFSGRRVIPFTGLYVALRRIHRVVAVVGVMVIGMLASQYARGLGSVIGSVIGDTSQFGLQIASVFAIPVVATTDGSLREGFDHFREAMSEQWGAVLVTATGTQALSNALGSVLFFATAVAAVVNGLAWADLGVEQLSTVTQFAVFVDPLGPATVPLALFAAMFAVPSLLLFGVGFPIKVLLYRYAIDGELPDGVAVDIEELATTSDPEEAGSSSFGVDAPEGGPL